MTIEATVNGKKWTGVGNLNQGEMKLNLKMDSEFTGKHYTLDFDLNPSGMWGIHITGDVDGPVDAKWTMRRSLNSCSTTPRPRSTSNSSTAQTLTPRTTCSPTSGSTLDRAAASGTPT